MNKDQIIIKQFQEVIDKITGKEYFNHCQFWTDFKIDGREWKIYKEGHFMPEYYAEFQGSASFTKMSIRISGSAYNEIRDYFESKILSLNFAK